MNSVKAVRGFAATALLSASLLSGCIVAPPPGYYRGVPVVTIAPPVPQVEVVGVAPTAGYIWFPGYWDWAGGAHVWHGGYWGPGRPGYYWAPHAWVRYGGGWRLAPGHWVRH
jgi:hypothetical protein